MAVFNSNMSIRVNSNAIEDSQGRGLQEIIREEIRNFDSKSQEGFQKTDLKTPLIYDLEKRIREIDGLGKEEVLPLEKLERVVEHYGVEEAVQVLDNIYPNGFKLGIYSDESYEVQNTLQMKDGQLYVFQDNQWNLLGTVTEGTLSMKDIRKFEIN